MDLTRRQLVISAAGGLAACAADDLGVPVEETTSTGPSVTFPSTSSTSTSTTTTDGTTTTTTTTTTDTDTGTSTSTTTTTPSTPGSGPEPSFPWEPEEPLDNAAFAWAVQTGDAHPTEIEVSVRTTLPWVTMRLAEGVDDGWEEVLEQPDLVTVDNVMQIRLTDLKPDTSYSVCFTTPGVRRSVAARFRTAVPVGRSRVIRFGASSCFGGNEPWPMLEHAAAEQLDFFVLLGDTVYADGYANNEIDDLWGSALSQSGFKALSSSTSLITTWDDHEVNNDWEWDDSGRADRVAVTLDAMLRAVPTRLGPNGLGLWRKLSWGDALDVFVLDCRSERVDGKYISEDQLNWLLDGLEASTATFKIICNSVPITDMSDVYFGVAADDRWDGYPDQRRRVLDGIRDRGITGALWIAGDFHWGAMATIGHPGEDHDDQFEIFCGPGGSFINPITLLLSSNDHYRKVIKQWNYTLFELDPDAGTARVVFVPNGGTPLSDETIRLV